MNDFFLIAEIVGFADNLGNLTLKSYSDFPDRFNKLTRVLIDVFGAYRQFVVEKCVPDGEEFIIKFANFNSSEDTRFLIGKKIFVREEDAVALPEDTYFVHDLIGSKVYREKVFIGKLVDVISLSSNDVYVVEGAEGNEILVPALKEYISKFDSKDKVLILSNLFEYDDED